MKERLKRLSGFPDTSITGRGVACSIILPNGEIYDGVNKECIHPIVHAEQMALMAMDEPMQFQELHIMSCVPFKANYAIPCDDCSDRLLQTALPGADIFLYYTGRKGVVESFRTNLKDFLGLNRPFERIATFDTGDITDFLSRNSDLSGVDRQLISTIHRSLAQDGVQLYLSGSALGKTGPGSMLNRTMIGASYWDIDVIMIFPEGYPDDIGKFVEGIYNNALGQVGLKSRILSEEKPPYKQIAGEHYVDEDFAFRRCYHAEGLASSPAPPDFKKDVSMPSKLDVSVGRTLESAMTSRYLAKNWCIRLS